MAVASALRREIHALDPEVELYSLLAMKDYIQAAFLAQRITATLLMALGVIAQVLAAMGIYGVMAYTVSLRTHEIGIRRALGAQTLQILRLVVGQGMRLVSVGVIVGLAGSLLVTRLLAGFLYGVSPFDPWTFLGVGALLVTVAMAACYVPALKAARVDPLVALRHD